jgi:biopolymer transport protein ExbD
MSFSTNGGGYGGRRRGGAPLSEINVTPFVDVVLVLLIIFMLTAHVMEYGIEVDVPATKNSQKTTKDLPVVTVSKSGEYTLNSGEQVNINQINQTIRKKYRGDEVYVRADKETIWDAVAQVTAELGAGKFKVNMVTQTLEGAKPGRK